MQLATTFTLLATLATVHAAARLVARENVPFSSPAPFALDSRSRGLNEETGFFVTFYTENNKCGTGKPSTSHGFIHTQSDGSSTRSGCQTWTAETLSFLAPTPQLEDKRYTCTLFGFKNSKCDVQHDVINILGLDTCYDASEYQGVVLACEIPGPE